MAKTPLRKKGPDPASLSDKEAQFVYEYSLDFNASRAAKKAGYKNPALMGYKILQKPKIANAIGALRKECLDHLKLTKEEILRQLYYCATKDAGEYVHPKTGELLKPHQLPLRARQAIDTIKQRVRTSVGEDGTEYRTVETEYRLVPKAQAIDMAMKHFGQYAEEKQEHTHKVTIDWDGMFERLQEISDPVEAQIIEARVLPRLDVTDDEPE